MHMIAILKTIRARHYLLSLALLGAVGLLLMKVAAGGPWNGFDVRDSLIPMAAIERGGPPRDGIPSIDEPRFTTIANSKWLKDDDRVLGLERNGIARAYPVAILNLHEIVNDTFGDEPITVTYCPLCGTGIAFKSNVNGQKLRFAVSGLLYNSDVLLFDRQTESLWSQIMGKAVTGQLKGAELQRIAMSHTSFRDWKKRFPKSTVLSRETGANRDYTRNPYEGYGDNRGVWFSISDQSDELHPKAWVVGVQRGNHFKAYPFEELARTGGVVREQLGGEEIIVRYDVSSRSVTVTDKAGVEIPTISAFWFAWYAFHPDTEVYRVDQ